MHSDKEGEDEIVPSQPRKTQNQIEDEADREEKGVPFHPRKRKPMHSDQPMHSDERKTEREESRTETMREKGMKREEQPGMMSMYTAALLGNASIFDNVTQYKFAIDLDQTGEYLPSLHAAARMGHHSFVKRMMESESVYGNYYIRLPNAEGDTLLHVAARCGRIEVVEELLTVLTKLNDEERQADFRVLTAANRYGRIPLHEAILNDHTDVAMKLIRSQLGSPENKRKKPTESTEDIKKALYFAVLIDREELVKKLAEFVGLEVPRDKSSESLIHIAVSKGSWKSFNFFVQQSPIRIETVDGFGRNVLHTAIIHGKWPTEWPVGIDSIVNEADIEGNTPLHLAVTKHRVRAIHWLIEKHANQRTINLDGLTALEIAREKNFRRIMDILVATEDDSGTEVEDDSGDEQDTEPKCRCHVLEGTTSGRQRHLQFVQAYTALLPLIATVSYTSVLTVPGAFTSLGVPVMLDHPAFKLFLILVAIAMGASMTGEVSLITRSSLKIMQTTLDVQKWGLMMACVASIAFFVNFLCVIFMMGAPIWVFIVACLICCVAFIYTVILLVWGVDRQ